MAILSSRRSPRTDISMPEHGMSSAIAAMYGGSGQASLIALAVSCIGAAARVERLGASSTMM
jgi:hypothetical protein